MSLLKLKAFFVYIVVYAGLINSCGTSDMKNRGIVARIGDVDSITFEELRWAVENETRYGKKDSRNVNPYLILDQMIDERIQVQLKQSVKPITSIESLQIFQRYFQRLRNKLLLDFVIKKKIVTDKVISYYYENQGHLATVQFIYIPYSDLANGVVRNRISAARIADSLSEKATPSNFQNLIDRFSETPGKMAHQMSKPSQFFIDALPISLVVEMITQPLGTILKPIEVKNAFIVARIVSIEKIPTAGWVTRSKKEIEVLMLNKLEDTDYLTLDSETSRFHKELDEVYSMRIHEKNVHDFYNIITTGADSILNDSNLICTINHIGNITYNDLLSEISPMRDALNSSESFDFFLRDFLMIRVYEKLITDSLENGEESIRLEKEKLKRIYITDENSNDNFTKTKIDSSVLRRFYEMNRELYREPAYVLYSEVRCLNADVAKTTSLHLNNKISFDKVADELVKTYPALKNKVNYKSKIKQVSTKVRNYFTQIYSLEPGEFTLFPYQNNDGTVSFYKLIEKHDSQVLPFDKVKVEVERDYISHKYRLDRLKAVNSFKIKFPIVVHSYLVEKLNNKYGR